MTRERNGPYAVGFGKPPEHTRFKKGQSGNPTGRPKGANGGGDILKEALASMVSVAQNGARRKMTKKELIVTQIVNKAATGDYKFIKLLATKTALFDPDDASETSPAADPPINPLANLDYEKLSFDELKHLEAICQIWVTLGQRALTKEHLKTLEELVEKARVIPDTIP